MNQAKPKDGLRDVIVGQTSVCTCGESDTLTYRGYAIDELAVKSSYEEVAYLLLFNKLPNEGELADFNRRLFEARKLPEALKNMLELIPAKANPMDIMRSIVSLLGILEPENSFEEQHDKAILLLGALPAGLAYWHQFSINGVKIKTQTQGSLAEHLLNTLLQTTASSEHIKALDTSLILYAEHEFNASTFAARTTAATLSDIYSAITSGIGTLRGNLHGGANEAAFHLIRRFPTKEAVEPVILDMLSRKEKIMGFGHAVYKTHDPRSDIIKPLAAKLASQHHRGELFKISEEIERILQAEKKLFPNVDFYCASLYHFLKIKTEFFTPIFVIARVAGWAAHVFEQRANNKLIRPKAEYIGLKNMNYTDIKSR